MNVSSENVPESDEKRGSRRSCGGARDQEDAIQRRYMIQELTIFGTSTTCLRRVTGLFDETSIGLKHRGRESDVEEFIVGHLRMFIYALNFLMPVCWRLG